MSPLSVPFFISVLLSSLFLSVVYISFTCSCPLALFSSIYPTSVCSYVSFICASSVSRFFFYLFISICSLLILYSFLFFISVSSSYLCFLSIYPGLLFSILYRVSFPMFVSLSFPFLCSSFSDLHNKTCNRSVCHNSGHEKVCVTPWTLILRYQFWMRFAALVFSDESRQSDLRVAPNRRWCCKRQTSLSSCAPFPHVQDTIMCRHSEPRHATCKATIATNLNINFCIAGSKNNTRLE